VTTQAGSLGFAMGLAQNNYSGAGSGYALRENANFGNNGTEDDLDLGTAGSKTASFTSGGNQDNILGFAAFLEAASVGVVTPPTRWLAAVGW